MGSIGDLMIFIFILIIIIYFAQIIFKQHLNKKWLSKPIKNFKFKHHGKDFWYSRACTVTLFVFTKNSNGEWCVLANKRGDKVPDFKGHWNIPCGYIDFDESGEEAAQRECYEETNVFIPLESVKFYSAYTNPSANKQNISLHYVTIFNEDLTNAFNLSDEHSEDGEVSEIQWIPISKINEYNWAFGHDVLVNRLSEQKLN